MGIGATMTPEVSFYPHSLLVTHLQPSLMNWDK